MALPQFINQIKNRFTPATFSADWFKKNARPSDISEFKTAAEQRPALPIFHATDSERAIGIFESRYIYGIDVVSSAHFHHTPDGAKRQALRQGVLLGFTWQGDAVKVDLSNNLTTHSDRRPNVLFDVPISKSDDETWELRLYPGTKGGLSLEYVELAGSGYTLHEPVLLEVIAGD